jgi:hypothetical protein
MQCQIIYLLYFYVNFISINFGNNIFFSKFFICKTLIYLEAFF